MDPATMTLFIWLSLAERPYANEMAADVCRAAEEAFRSGSEVIIKELGRKAVRVECVAACPDQEATS